MLALDGRQPINCFAAVSALNLMPHARTVYDAAVKWLVESHIRRPDGGYRSIYKPASRDYENFNRCDTCLLATSGATQLLNELGHINLALGSAEHILDLQIKSGPAQGAIPVGKNGRHCVPSYISVGALALLRMYEVTDDDRFLEAANRAGAFVIQRMQLGDGSIATIYALQRRYRLAMRYLLPRQIWQARCAELFLELHKITGKLRYRRAAVRLRDWLCGQQRPDGSFPLQSHTLASAAFASLRSRSVSSTARARHTSHPAANTWAIQTLVKFGNTDEARRSAQWIAGGLGPNGLLYQYYYGDGSTSVEEDVMPTAHLSLLGMDCPELGLDQGLPGIVARGIAYAQIRSDDPDANGAIRGLPLHETRGDQAYTWDTIFSIRLLRKLLSDSVPRHDDD
jgi:hypothetical protein